MALASPQMPIAELRRWLERMESHGRASAAVLPFGIAEVDAHVPGGGLQLGHLHEVIEGGAASEYAGLATLFAAGIVARLAGPVLWCLRGRDLFAPALARIGLHPDRVIYCETWNDRDVLPGDGGRAEMSRPRRPSLAKRRVCRLTASRRLQLCAGESGVTALVIRRWHNATERAQAERAQCGCDALAYFTASLAAEGLRWLGPAALARRIAACAGRRAAFLDFGGVRCDGSSRSTCRIGRATGCGGRGGDAPPRDKPLVTAMMQGQRRVLASVDEAAARVGLSMRHDGDARPIAHS